MPTFDASASTSSIECVVITTARSFVNAASCRESAKPPRITRIDMPYRSPSLSLAEWVDTRAELIDEDDRSITDEGDRQAELALVSARQGRGEVVRLGKQSCSGKQDVDVLRESATRNTFETAVQPQMLPDCLVSGSSARVNVPVRCVSMALTCGHTPRYDRLHLEQEFAVTDVG